MMQQIITKFPTNNNILVASFNFIDSLSSWDLDLGHLRFQSRKTETYYFHL